MQKKLTEIVLLRLARKLRNCSNPVVGLEVGSLLYRAMLQDYTRAVIPIPDAADAGLITVPDRNLKISCVSIEPWDCVPVLRWYLEGKHEDINSPVDRVSIEDLFDSLFSRTKTQLRVNAKRLSNAVGILSHLNRAQSIGDHEAMVQWDRELQALDRGSGYRRSSTRTT